VPSIEAEATMMAIQVAPKDPPRTSRRGATSIDQTRTRFISCKELRSKRTTGLDT
jgi:hypothetical protein